MSDPRFVKFVQDVESLATKPSRAHPCAPGADPMSALSRIRQLCRDISEPGQPADPYFQHDPDCAVRGRGTCDCGWDTACKVFGQNST